MSQTVMTLNEVRLRGMDALRRELGVVGMVRFLQQFDSGRGDYSTERHAALDGLDLDEVVAAIHRKRKPMQPRAEKPARRPCSRRVGRPSPP